MRYDRAVLLLFALVIELACESTPAPPTTKTVITVSADTSIMEKAGSLYVRADSDDDALLVQELTNDLWMHPFVVEPPGGDAKRSFTLLAEAFDKSREVLAQGRLKTGFVAGQTLYAHLSLSACKKVVVAELNPTDLAPSAALGNAVMAECQPDQPSGKAGAGAHPMPGGTGGEAGMATSGGGRGAGGAGAEVTDTCGDGVLNGEELCDTKIAAGKLGACPSSCSTQDACRRGHLIGSGCQTRCDYTKIKEAIRDDGCCPAGADANADNDCEATCGNSLVEVGETCDPPADCTVTALCGPAPACTQGVLLGSADQCNATCELQLLKDCTSGDGCCPDGCSHDQDDDCPVKCGDGHIDTDEGETCEPSTCPQSCSDTDPCTDDVMTGSPASCNVRCWHAPHMTARNSDGCCPAAANANNDNDCRPKCGNGVLESGELCDGNCPSSAVACDDGDACTTDTLTGSGCQRRCTRAEPSASPRSDACCPTGASEREDPDCVNLLANRTFESSVSDSQAEPGHPVTNITDGNDDTRWISMPASPVTLSVDLGATHTLRRIEIIWAGDTIKYFTLEVSANSSNWTPIVSGTTDNVPVEPEHYEMFSADPTGRYFRITSSDRWVSSYGNSIYEVRLYGR